MTTKRSPSAERKQRPDAQQNRERILTVARRAFTKSGANASLEDIAKQAGVGIGTLYRHFSTREGLLKAVYFDVTTQLAKPGHEFTATFPPSQALRDSIMFLLALITT